MICVWQIYGDIQDFTSIAEIFMSNSGGVTTICDSRISNEKVWIKVCNVNFRIAWLVSHFALMKHLGQAPGSIV